MSDYEGMNVVNEPSKPRRGVLSRLKAHNLDLLLILLVMLVVTYALALHFLYRIVGG